MNRLLWGKGFVRAYKRLAKRRPDLRERLEETLRLLQQDPFQPSLETRKLKGKLEGAWACSVTFDVRIVFDLCPTEKPNARDIVLIDLGTHDEVY